MSATRAEPQRAELLTHRDGAIAYLTLDRPRRRNALSRRLVADLHRALTTLAVDPQVRVVVLRASGGVFSSGHDLTEMLACDQQEYRRLFAACAEMMLAIRRLPQPVIARVQGLATAAGCQLVASCDLAVASDEARFAVPGVHIGLFCTTPMVPLARSVMPKLAMEMLLTGREITAAEALAAGLVNRVVSPGELDAAVTDLAMSIVAASPAVVRLGKQAFYEQLTLDEPTAYARAVEVMAGNAMLSDAQEGMRAFLEKRPPRFSGP